MNRLVLLGNGFDLAHGLPTSYENFIFNYTKEEIIDCLNSNVKGEDKKLIGFLNIELVRKNKCRIDSKYANISIKHCEDFKNKDELIQYLKDYCVTDNHWPIEFEYLDTFAYNLATENKGGNWSDIEAYFYKKLIDYLDLDNTNNNKKKKKDRDGILTEVKTLNEEFEKVKLALEFYLEKYVEDKFEFKPHQEFIDILIGNKDTKSTRLLNFNYTKTAEMYLPELKKNNPTQLINIHGKLNDDMENPMIFGFGDEYDKKYTILEEFNENSLFEHIKSFGYFKSRSYNEMTNFVDGGEYEVFIIGHSCGLSDRTLLKYLFENENCTSIKIFYYEGKDFYKSRNNHNYITREISRHFTNKGEMRNKIVNFLDSEPCPQVQLKEIT